MQLVLPFLFYIQMFLIFFGYRVDGAGSFSRDPWVLHPINPEGRLHQEAPEKPARVVASVGTGWRSVHPLLEKPARAAASAGTGWRSVRRVGEQAALVRVPWPGGSEARPSHRCPNLAVAL